MSTIEGLQYHPSRLRSITYDPINSDEKEPLYEYPEDIFFSEKNISKITQEVNVRLGKLGYPTSINIPEQGYIVNQNSIIRVMRSIYQSAFLHRDIDYMNNATIQGIVQNVKDNIDFIDMNRKRSKWILNFYPESGITRMNSTSIKLNRRKPFAPVYAFSNQ